MKRNICLILLLVLLASVLAGCAAESAEPITASINVDNMPMTVTFDDATRASGTIQSENGTYTFSYTVSGQKANFQLVYPDGVVYTQTGNQYGASGGYSGEEHYFTEREEKGYVDGMSMEWALEDAVERGGRRKSGGSVSPFVGILLIALGVWNLAAPYSAWYLSRGWYYKNAEPSDAAIGMYRLTGGIAAVAGIIALIAAF